MSIDEILLRRKSLITGRQISASATSHTKNSA